MSAYKPPDDMVLCAKILDAVRAQLISRLHPDGLASPPLLMFGSAAVVDSAGSNGSIGSIGSGVAVEDGSMAATGSPDWVLSIDGSKMSGSSEYSASITHPETRTKKLKMAAQRITIPPCMSDKHELVFPFTLMTVVIDISVVN